MAQLNFDARQVKPDEGQQDPIPAAWYNAIMDQSEMKPTSDGNGMRLAVRFSIIDGPYVGRKVFEGLNLQNANAVAQEIAYKQLSAIAHAVNVLLVEDSSQLHNIPLKIKVTLVPASGQYAAKNDIKAYKNINEQVGGAAVGAAPASSPFGPPPGAAPAMPAWVPPTAGAQPWAQPQAPAAAPAAAPAWAPPGAPAWAAAPAAPAAPAAAPAAPAAGVTPPWAAPAGAAPAGAATPPWMQQPAG